jgi:hypothetical protein
MCFDTSYSYICFKQQQSVFYKNKYIFCTFYFNLFIGLLYLIFRYRMENRIIFSIFLKIKHISICIQKKNKWVNTFLCWNKNNLLFFFYLWNTKIFYLNNMNIIIKNMLTDMVEFEIWIIKKKKKKNNYRPNV